MSEDNHYKKMADKQNAAKRQQVEQQQAAQKRAAEDNKASFESAKSWWDGSMLPEIQQAKTAFPSLAWQTEKVRGSEHDGGLVMRLIVNASLPAYLLSIHQGNVQVSMDFSKINRGIAHSSRNEPGLAGRIDEPGYARRFLSAVLDN